MLKETRAKIGAGLDVAAMWSTGAIVAVGVDTHSLLLAGIGGVLAIYNGHSLAKRLLRKEDNTVKP